MIKYVCACSTLTPVCAAPQVSDNLVDLIHLHAVEFHDGSGKQKNRAIILHLLVFDTVQKCKKKMSQSKMHI